MSNLIYTDEMYNEYQKSRFINQANISEGTAEGYKIVFKKSATLENQFGKDLYDFNLPEIEQVLKYLGGGVATTVQNYVSVIKNYIYWAIAEDLRTTGKLNPFNDVNLDLKYYEQFVEAPRDKKLFTEKTIWRDIIGKSVNAQDGVIISLLFEGVNTEEILNLKKDDIYPNSDTLVLRNDKGESRKIIVNEKTISLCNQALQQEEYEKLNGNSSAKAKILGVVKNDHVVRSVQSNTIEGEARADVHAIYRRLKMLGEQLEYPYLTTMNIRNSGMLSQFKNKYFENNGVIVTEHYYEICERFGLKRSRDINGTLTFNHYPLKASFLNEEMMKSVYGEENSSL